VKVYTLPAAVLPDRRLLTAIRPAEMPTQMPQAASELPSGGSSLATCFQLVPDPWNTKTPVPFVPLSEMTAVFPSIDWLNPKSSPLTESGAAGDRIDGPATVSAEWTPSTSAVRWPHPTDKSTPVTTMTDPAFNILIMLA
jgi:hypothetical protein